MDGTKAYILSKGYTEKTVLGGGALKGKNSVVEKIEKTGKQNDVTFKSTLDNGTVERKHMFVLDGADGVSPTITVEDITGGIEITVTNAEGDPITKQIMNGSDGTMKPIEVGTVTTVASSEDADVDIREENDTYYLDFKIPRGESSSQGGGGSAELQTALHVTQTVGGITSGKDYPAETSLEQIIRDMLSPVLNPTLTAPSGSLSVSGSKVLEAGSSVSKTFTATLNRGSISPAYGTSGYRSGAATSYALNGGTAQASGSFTETVSESNKNFQVVINYAAGEQPKNSAGENYSTPLAAGSVTTNKITYEFVDCLWANVSNIATVAKQSVLAKSTRVKQFDYPATTEANPEVFDVPSDFNVTAVEVLNSLSNQWEDASDQFTTTNTTHNNAAGTSVNYVRYTCNLGIDIGDRKVRVKWN